MNIRPLEDRIVVLPAAPVTVTAGGLVLPEAAQTSTERGTVVAVGSGRVSAAGVLIEHGINVGDEVIHAKFGGTKVTVEGEDYFILAASEIIAILS